MIGVQEPSAIVGTDVERFERVLALALKRIIGPITVVGYTVNVDRLQLGVIDVQKATVPVSTPEGYYERMGEQVRPMHAHELVAKMSAVPDHSVALQGLTTTVEKLSDEIRSLNSWKKKLLWGVIGAFIGVAFSLTGRWVFDLAQPSIESDALKAKVGAMIKKTISSVAPAASAPSAPKH